MPAKTTNLFLVSIFRAGFAIAPKDWGFSFLLKKIDTPTHDL